MSNNQHRSESQFHHLDGIHGAAQDAREAEIMVSANPRTSIMYARKANETLIKRTYKRFIGPPPCNTVDAIRALANHGILDPAVTEIAHRVRAEGNDATHTNKPQSEGNALAVLFDLWEVSTACAALLRPKQVCLANRFDSDLALRIGHANDHEAARGAAEGALHLERQHLAALEMQIAAFFSLDATEAELLAVSPAELFV